MTESKKKGDLVHRYTSISVVIDTLTRKQLCLLDPLSWDDRNDRHYMELYKQHRKVEAIFAACCTLSKETYHHWHVFSGSVGGAYLELHRDALERHLEALKTQGHRLRYQAVRYYDLDQIEGPGTTPDDFPFAKRRGFQDEAEYRIVAENNDDDITYPIPLPLNLISRVVINPWLPKSIYESVRLLLKQINGCENLRIAKSQLIDSTRWKAAGIRKMHGELRRRERAAKPSKKSTGDR